VNGMLAPPLIFMIVVLNRDAMVMGDAVSSGSLNLLGWIAFTVMVAAAVGLLVAS